MTTAAIVLAGGAGTRLNPSENKVYLPVAGRPLLAWSLQSFEDSELVDEIVLVIRSEDRERARSFVQATPLRKLGTVVEGGPTRHASEHAGLEALASRIEHGGVDLVCIHDAARPFVGQAMLARILRSAREHGGAVPGLEVPGSVLLRATEDERPTASVATHDLRRVQTPQAFHARALVTAYRRAAQEGFAGVDTAESVERYSDLSVRVVDGDPDNIKVTFVEDLFAVEALATRWPHRGG